MLSIPLLGSSALLSGFVMPTEPLKLPHNIYSCCSWMLVTRDYFAISLAPVSCCTAVCFGTTYAALSFHTPVQVVFLL